MNAHLNQLGLLTQKIENADWLCPDLRHKLQIKTFCHHLKFLTYKMWMF